MRLLKFRVPENSVLNNMQIANLPPKMMGNILICAIERGEQLVIPDGNCVLHAKDLVTIVGAPADAYEFFRQAAIVVDRVKSLMIVGGSPTAYYLAKIMIAGGVRVKIVEKNMKRCESLCDLLPKATIVYGDGTDKDLLLEEGIAKYESFAALTNIDEENILLSF